MLSRLESARSWLRMSSCNMAGLRASSIVCRSNSGLFNMWLISGFLCNNGQCQITSWFVFSLVSVMVGFEFGVEMTFIKISYYDDKKLFTWLNPIFIQ